MNIENIIDLRKYLSVREHKNGKISLQLSVKALSDPKLKEIVQENKNKPMPSAIYSTSIQKLARIVNIEYDTKLIDPSELEEIFTTRNRAQFNLLVAKYLSVLST